jgi:opacity protein-like surface antigen
MMTNVPLTVKRTHPMKKSQLLTLLLMMVVAATGTLRAQTDDEWGKLRPFVLAEGSYTRALGELSSAFPSNVGGYLGYAFPFHGGYVLHFRAGYAEYDVDDDAAASGDYSLRVIQFLGAARHYFARETVMPYMVLGVGLNLVMEETEGLASYTENRTTGQFAWQFGFGATVPVTGPVGLDVAVKYNAHFLYHEAMMTGFEYSAGVAWFVGK